MNEPVKSQFIFRESDFRSTWQEIDGWLNVNGSKDITNFNYKSST